MLRIVLDPVHRRKLLTGAIIVLVLLAGWWWHGHPTAPNTPTPSDPSQAQGSGEPADPTEGTQATPAPLGVDVIGAVQQPGMYFLPAGARVEDAVQVAGGLAPNANREAINMSAHLTDGQQLRVPHVGEAAAAAVVNTSIAGTNSPAHININTANAATLATLPGIGQVLAQRIIDYRTTHGPFGAIGDLRNVTGIHATLFDKIKDSIQVGNAP
ncbi:MAG: helix-hairpin-helix domain-containing protein [Herpetosiphonaceae bacterium]|nr:helix-hairpin-helix domain-containing protein [Herpetosiphonaceae bacterium]